MLCPRTNGCYRDQYTTCSGRLKAVKSHGSAHLGMLKSKATQCGRHSKMVKSSICDQYHGQPITCGDVVVFTHPFKK